MYILSVILASVLPLTANHNTIGGMKVVTNTIAYVSSATNDAVNAAIDYSTNHTAAAVANKRDVLDLSIYKSQYSSIFAVFKSGESEGSQGFSFIGETAERLQWNSQSFSLVYNKEYSRWMLYSPHYPSGSIVAGMSGDNTELEFTMEFVYGGSYIKATFTRDCVSYPVKDGNRTLTPDGNMLHMTYVNPSNSVVSETSSFIIDAYRSGWPVNCEMSWGNVKYMLHMDNLASVTNSGIITYGGYFSGFYNDVYQNIYATIFVSSAGSKATTVYVRPYITQKQFNDGLNMAATVAYNASTGYTSSAFSDLTNRVYLADKGDMTSKAGINTKWAMFGISRPVIEDRITGRISQIDLFGAWGGSRGYCSKLLVWINSGLNSSGLPDSSNTTLAAISDNIAYEVDLNNPISYRFASGITIPYGSRLLVSFCNKDFSWESVRDLTWDDISTTYPPEGSMRVLGGMLTGNADCIVCGDNSVPIRNKCLEAKFYCISPVITEKSVIDIAGSSVVTNAGSLEASKDFAREHYVPLEGGVINGNLFVSTNTIGGTLRSDSDVDNNFRMVWWSTLNPTGDPCAFLGMQNGGNTNVARFVFASIEANESEYVKSELYPDGSRVLTEKYASILYPTNAYTREESDARFLQKTETAADSDKLGGNAPSFFATADELSGKADKIGAGHADEVPIFDATGNVKYSGHKINSLATFEEDTRTNRTAFTIGYRHPGFPRGIGSFVHGTNSYAIGNYSFAGGYNILSSGNHSHVLGVSVTDCGHDNSFTWSGSSDVTYYSRGNGTFNINPTGGTDGFWIGNTNLTTYLANAGGGGGGVSPSVVTGIVESASVTNKGAMAYADETFLGKTDAAADSNKLGGNEPSFFATSSALGDKADKVQNPVAGNLLISDAQGNIINSGKITNDFVELVKDSNGNKTAIWLGPKHPEKTNDVAGVSSLAAGMFTHAAGDYSFANGISVSAYGVASHAEGTESLAHGNYAHADGLFASATNNNSYAWNGDDSTEGYYESHGIGTYNVNPKGGTDGFWIGSTNLTGHIQRIGKFCMDGYLPLEAGPSNKISGALHFKYGQYIDSTSTGTDFIGPSTLTEFRFGKLNNGGYVENPSVLVPDGSRVVTSNMLHDITTGMPGIKSEYTDPEHPGQGTTIYAQETGRTNISDRLELGRDQNVSFNGSSSSAGLYVDRSGTAYYDGQELTHGGMSPSTVTSIVESASVTNAGAVAEAKAYSSSTFAPKVDGGYLPLSAGSAYPISKDCAGLFLGESGYIDFYGDNESWHTPMYITFNRTEGKFLFGLEAENESPLIPDSSPIATMNMLSGNYLSLTGGTMTGAVIGYVPTDYKDPSFIASSIIQFGREDNKIGDLGAGYMNYSSLDGEHRFYTSNFEGLQSTLTVDGTDVLTQNKGDGRYAQLASNPTNGNFATLTAQGSLQDSGKKASDFATASALNGYLPLSAGSSNVLTSALFMNDYGGIYIGWNGDFCNYGIDTEQSIGEPGLQIFSKTQIEFRRDDHEGTMASSMLTPDDSDVLTATKAETDYPIITHAASEFAPAVEGGYLPRSAGMNYNITGDLWIKNSNIDQWDDGTLEISSGTSGLFVFSPDGVSPNGSCLIPDGTDIMTEGKADFHIVSNATVTSGQIANVDLTGLTNKTVVINFSSTTTKAGDALLWTGGNTEDCTMTFSVTPNTLVPHGDDGYLKATANKKCLFLFDKVSATDIIITKKEFD